MLNALDNVAPLVHASTHPCSAAARCVSSQAAWKPCVSEHEATLLYNLHSRRCYKMHSCLVAEMIMYVYLSAGEDSAWCTKQLRLCEVCAEAVTARYTPEQG